MAIITEMELACWGQILIVYFVLMALEKQCSLSSAASVRLLQQLVYYEIIRSIENHPVKSWILFGYPTVATA